MTYKVTSNPSLISVAIGLVHMAVLLSSRFIVELYAYVDLVDTRKP